MKEDGIACEAGMFKKIVASCTVVGREGMFGGVVIHGGLFRGLWMMGGK